MSALAGHLARRITTCRAGPQPIPAKPRGCPMDKSMSRRFPTCFVAKGLRGPGGMGIRRPLIPDSSAVEQSTVNRLVAGSNPAPGASFFHALARDRARVRFLPALRSGLIPLASIGLRGRSKTGVEQRHAPRSPPSEHSPQNRLPLLAKTGDRRCMAAPRHF
jgi:hypothetical protein